MNNLSGDGTFQIRYFNNTYSQIHNKMYISDYRKLNIETRKNIYNAYINIIDSLTLDEWVTYLSKMGIGASIVTPMAEGMLSGSEK